MKKLFIILMLCLVGSVCFTTEYAHYGFSVKCAKCAELKLKDPCLEQQIAWRTCDYKKENGKTYALYKCRGGHSYWAVLK